MKRPVVALALILSLAGAHAGEAERLQLAREVIQASQVDKMIDAMTGQIQQMSRQMAGPGFDSLPADQKALAEAFIAKTVEVAMAESKVILAKMDAVYAGTFTEDELLAVRDFYRSPAGKSLIEKQPILMQKLMPELQGMQRTLMPKLQAMGQEFEAQMKELKAKEAAQKAAAEPVPAGK
jgi:uncharacterized protein